MQKSKKKPMTNKDVLDTVMNLTVKEAVSFIEKLEQEIEIIDEVLPEKIDDDEPIFDFKVLPNVNYKGKHKKPFYIKNRW